MASTSPSLTLIVAATVKNGIGKNGNLPWPMLKKEMAYFARVTKRVPKHLVTSDAKAHNVVIMGRKTWDSIPQKLRPLKERTNIVITRQDPKELSITSPDVIVAPSIQAGLQELQRRSTEMTAPTAGRVFVIGGSSIYDAALKLPTCDRILLTRVHKEYDCDIYFPISLDSDKGKDASWRRKSVTELSEFVEEPVEDGDMEVTVEGETIRYRFCLYEKSQA